MLFWGVIIPFAQAQAQSDEGIIVDLALIKTVMRGAESFSEKAGDPPVYTVYSGPVQDEESLMGYVFYSPDYPPEEIGYSAPIDMLVGLDTQGTITGLNVVYYRESYKSIRGDFLSTEGFQRQFRGMEVADPFRVGRDVDGVSRATITSWAVSRGLRNAARRVAMAYLGGEASGLVENVEEQALQLMAEMSWQQMIAAGYVRELVIPLSDGTSHRLSFAYIGHDRLAELMVGVNEYSRAERDASSRVRSGHMMLAGIDGNASAPFRQEKLSIRQNGEEFDIPRRRFVYAGSADNGKIANQARFAGAIVMPDEIDISQPLEIIYDLGADGGEHFGVYTIDYSLAGVPLALVQGTPIPPDLLPAEEGAYEEEPTSGVAALFANADWQRVIPLFLILPLVYFAFRSKNSRLRWIALSCTMLYLGFIDGGFLSVSHITNGLKLGPSLFLNDLPLLMLVLFTLITTLLWGRVFCSSLCPFGALQDFLGHFVPKRWQRKMPQAIHDKAIYIKYGILAFILLMAMVQSEVSYFQYFEPFGTIFFVSPSVLLWAILIGFLLASSVIKRFYCRYACPLGAALGVLSFISPFRINRVQQCDVCKVCEHSCPTGAIRGPEIDFKECVRCDICEGKLIDQAGVCKHDVEDLKGRIKNWEPIPVQQIA